MPKTESKDTMKITPAKITKETIATLSQHFVTTPLPLIKALPRGNFGKKLVTTKLAHELVKLQVLRQLNDFKEKKYQLKDIVLLQLLEQTREILEEEIDRDYFDFSTRYSPNV
jgi:hypothetical protein